MRCKKSKGEELRDISIKILRAGGIFLLVLGVCVWGWDYKLVKGDARDLSFYESAPSDWTAGRISGRDVRRVILCIGDGMGPNQIAMARHKIVGADGKLWMETLPVAGLMRTFSTDSVITDSAAAVTGMACGVKTNNAMLGMGPDDTWYASILETLSKKGWRTGLVATSTITHATPAGFASHVIDRNNEDVIAEQMLEARVDILFGGGRQFWIPEDAEGSKRKDAKNLIEAARRMGYVVIGSRDEMLDLKYGPVLGLFTMEAMTTYAPEPMLSEMTQTAIRLLSAGSKEWFAPEPKFFMMVEGSQIDWAGHAKDTENCIRQTLLFDMAVKEAIDFARRDRHTLVIVTADHETGALILNKDKKNTQKIVGVWNSGDHSGADVAVFAYGPGSQEFGGTMDNTEIAKKIAKLLKISPFPQEVKAPEVQPGAVVPH
jgi:alkaline phosphatase